MFGSETGSHPTQILKYQSLQSLIDAGRNSSETAFQYFKLYGGDLDHLSFIIIIFFFFKNQNQMACELWLKLVVVEVQWNWLTLDGADVDRVQIKRSNIDINIETAKKSSEIEPA